MVGWRQEEFAFALPLIAEGQVSGLRFHSVIPGRDEVANPES
jgi:hypothetical protein